jgi:tRNA/tmRNA/rRNA uracil-C5-methylase (TrmA/RlmC/RlmD family)
MLHSLEWLVSRLQAVIDGDRPLHMLEMYCGCGAHTVALAIPGLLHSIVAVELNGRLVDACAENCRNVFPIDTRRIQAAMKTVAHSK